MKKSFKNLLVEQSNRTLLFLFLFILPIVLISSFYMVQYTMDNNLKQNASILLSIAKHELGEVDDSSHAKSFGGEDVLFQVFLNDRLTIHSKNAPDFKVFKNEGIETVRINEDFWRVLHLNDNGVSLYIGEKVVKRLYVAYWALFLISLLGVVFYFILRIVFKKSLFVITNELKNTIKEIYENNTTKKITFEEFEPIINKIQNYKNDLEEYIKKEKEFLEIVSHELRTPLAIMKINLEKKDVNSIVFSYEKIEQIINQFLLFTKGNKESYKLISVVESLKESLEEILDIHPEIDFDIEIKKDFYVYSNTFLLKIIFNNLLLNSILKGEKEIHICIDNNQILIEDFHKPLEDKRYGFGIGLLLVEKILLKMNSKYEIYNNKYGGVSVKIDIDGQEK